MDLPGFRLHALKGILKGHYAVSVSTTFQSTHPRDRWQERILVVLAGKAATDRWRADDREFRVRNDGDDEDRKLADQILNAAQVDGDTAQRTLLLLERKILALFSRPKVWKATQGLANRLLFERHLSGAAASLSVKLDLERRLPNREIASLAAGPKEIIDETGEIGN